jgi:hypothetical protein
LNTPDEQNNTHSKSTQLPAHENIARADADHIPHIFPF